VSLLMIPPTYPNTWQSKTDHGGNMDTW
jgi:hypothetical protein